MIVERGCLGLVGSRFGSAQIIFEDRTSVFIQLKMTFARRHGPLLPFVTVRASSLISGLRGVVEAIEFLKMEGEDVR